MQLNMDQTLVLSVKHSSGVGGDEPLEAICNEYHKVCIVNAFVIYRSTDVTGFSHSHKPTQNYHPALQLYGAAEPLFAHSCGFTIHLLNDSFSPFLLYQPCF